VDVRVAVAAEAVIAAVVAARAAITATPHEGTTGVVQLRAN
jgi:hypothetical protein